MPSNVDEGQHSRHCRLIVDLLSLTALTGYAELPLSERRRRLYLSERCAARGTFGLAR